MGFEKTIEKFLKKIKKDTSDFEKKLIKDISKTFNISIDEITDIIEEKLN
jgi:energy-converting hydrogenase A subunit M